MATLGAALAGSGGLQPVRPSGSGGWSLERFGGDATILRTAVPFATRGDPGSLILSCGSDRRRLTLTVPPEAWARFDGAGPANLLFRALGPDPSMAPFVVARGALTAAHTLIVTETGPPVHSPIVGFVGLLLVRPIAIDMLLHTGGRPIRLRQLTAVRLPLSSGPDDEAAFRDFIRACTEARGTRWRP